MYLKIMYFNFCTIYHKGLEFQHQKIQTQSAYCGVETGHNFVGRCISCFKAI